MAVCKQTIRYGKNVQSVNGTTFYQFPFHKMDVVARNEYAADKTLTGTWYTLTVRGVITTATNGVSLRDEINKMKYWLLQPRQDMYVEWYNGAARQAPMFIGRSPESDRDNAWGPLPIDLQVKEFSGGLAASYVWVIECFHKESRKGPGGLNPYQTTARFGNGANILSLEIGYDFTIDSNFQTTRVTSGKLVIDTVALNQNKHGPSYYRNFCVPALPEGFQRQRMDFHVDVDGRTMTFNVVDAERRHALPVNITDGQATVSHVVAPEGGFIRWSLSGWFSCPKTVSRGVLIQAIIDLAKSKLPVDDKDFILESRTMSADVYDNRVQFSYQGRQVWVAVTNPALNASATLVPPEFARLISAPPGGAAFTQVGPWGTANLVESPRDYDKPYDASYNPGLTSSGFKPPKFVPPPNVPEPKPPVIGAPAPATNGASAAHKTTPIYAWTQCLSFECDNRVRVFVAKDGGTSPTIQQTGSPVVHCIDAGYCVFASASAKDGPPPPKPNGSYIVRQWYVSPTTPVPLGDGSLSLWRYSWRYLLVKKTTVSNTKEVELTFPPDPRRATQPGLVLDANKLPELVVDPKPKKKK